MNRDERTPAASTAEAPTEDRRESLDATRPPPGTGSLMQMLASRLGHTFVADAPPACWSLSPVSELRGCAAKGEVAAFWADDRLASCAVGFPTLTVSGDAGRTCDGCG